MKRITTTLILSSLAAISMANNVQAQISSHDLHIQGDALGNQIRIDRTLTGVRVVGLNGTLVNGLPMVNFVTGPLVNFSAKMEGGNDYVAFRNVGNLGDVVIECGLGNDAVLVSGSAAQASIKISGEAGADRLAIDDSHAYGDILLDGGIGANTLRSVRTRCDENFSALGGDLSDRMDFGNLLVGGSMSISADKGNDWVNIASATIGLSLHVGTDVGSDRVTLNGIQTGEDVSVETGDQNDTAILSNVSALKNVFLSLDSGDDRLTCSNVVAAHDAIAIGGAGFDLFTNLGFVGGAKTDIIEFE